MYNNQYHASIGLLSLHFLLDVCQQMVLRICCSKQKQLLKVIVCADITVELFRLIECVNIVMIIFCFRLIFVFHFDLGWNIQIK